MGKNAERPLAKPIKGQPPKRKGKLGRQDIPVRTVERMKPATAREYARLGPRSLKRSKKPRRGRPEVPRSKVSIAIAPEDLAWATETAQLLGVSVSRLFTDGLELYRRKYALGKLLDELWPDDPGLTDEERQVVRDEWASVGFKP